MLQKVALVPKGITELSPLVSSPAVAHFITAPQQLNGKVRVSESVNQPKFVLAEMQIGRKLF